MFKKLDNFMGGIMQPIVNKAEYHRVNFARVMFYVGTLSLFLASIQFAISVALKVHGDELTVRSFFVDMILFGIIFYINFTQFSLSFYRLSEGVDSSEPETVLHHDSMCKGKVPGIVWRLYAFPFILIFPSNVMEIFRDLHNLSDVFSYIKLDGGLVMVAINTMYLVLALASGCDYRGAGKSHAKETHPVHS